MKTAKLLQKICAALSAAALCIGSMAAMVFADNAPRNLEISIDTLEEKAGSLHSSDKIDLPVRIANNSGFYSMSLIFQADNNWDFNTANPIQTHTAGFGGVTYTFLSPKILLAEMACSTVDSYHGNGEIMSLSLEMGDHPTEGDYTVRLLTVYGSSKIKISTSSASSAEYGAECFSLLKSGGIHWKKDEPRTQPPAINPIPTTPPQTHQVPSTQVQQPPHSEVQQADEPQQQQTPAETQPSEQDVLQTIPAETTTSLTETTAAESTSAETTAESTSTIATVSDVTTKAQTLPQISIEFADAAAVSDEKADSARDPRELSKILIIVTVILSAILVVAVGADIILTKKQQPPME